MELRSLEKEMNDMAMLYESLRQSSSDKGRHTDRGHGLNQLPPLVLALEESQAKDESSGNQNDLQGEASRSLADILSALELQRQRITELASKMDRYRKRLNEKDPVTEKPRYGDATAKRVKTMLDSYEAISSALRMAFGEAEENEQGNISQKSTVVDDIRGAVEEQKEQERKAELDLAMKKAQSEAEKWAEEQQCLEEERNAKAAALEARRQEEADLARRAQEARRAREAAEQARLDAERQEREEANRWADSIPKGPDGVQKQLSILREKIDAVEHAVAINALHTLFSQIVSRPEEANFRRIRQDHPRFHEDIGQHPGGQELLIAAGFRLGAIDGVPCFISTEPNVEKDLDGWSQWFDSLKSTLKILEEELMK